MIILTAGIALFQILIAVTVAKILLTPKPRGATFIPIQNAPKWRVKKCTS